jgi:hypothetical protein
LFPQGKVYIFTKLNLAFGVAADIKGAMHRNWKVSMLKDAKLRRDANKAWKFEDGPGETG